MNILLITPTGYRPEAFRLCMSYVMRQTQQQFEWMVVDDSVNSEALRALGTIHPSKVCGVKPSLIMAEPRSDGPTLGQNLKEAFAKINTGFCKRRPDIVLFIEDDGWYHPSYIEAMVNGFVLNPQCAAVGESNAVYYHVPTGQYRDMGNGEHASLCSTAIRADLIPLLVECIEERPIGFDILFWNRLRSENAAYYLYNGNEVRRVIGIKGLPGRIGIGTGHRPDDSWQRDDTERSYLNSLIGLDEQNYRQFYLASPD